MTAKEIEGVPGSTYEDKFYVENGLDVRKFGPFTTPADVRAALEMAIALGGGEWDVYRERLIRERWPDWNKVGQHT